jgi:ubiquinone/menaquinone biosynthesis C-methylase UbiE
MAQNIYDTQEFYENYRKLPRSVSGLDGAPEWPTLRSLVGDVKGLRVLDLGCGLGWFCRWAVEAGASSVHGIEISEKMLEGAREFKEGKDQITYEQADLEKFVLEKQSFDVAYSSLVLHYLPDLTRFLAEVRSSLKPGGKFVVSIEHPIMTAPSTADWKTDEEGNVHWPLNRYMDEGLRVTNWLAPGVRKYHRTVETYLNALINAGFTISGFRESWENIELHNDNKRKGEFHRPYFLLLAAKVDEEKKS